MTEKNTYRDRYSRLFIAVKVRLVILHATIRQAINVDSIQKLLFLRRCIHKKNLCYNITTMRKKYSTDITDEQ